MSQFVDLSEWKTWFDARQILGEEMRRMFPGQFVSMLDLKLSPESTGKQFLRHQWDTFAKMPSIGCLIPVHFHVSVDKIITVTKVSQFVFTHKPKDYGLVQIQCSPGRLKKTKVVFCPKSMR